MEHEKNVRSFLGSGCKFPVAVDGATGRIKMASSEENIQESVRIILGTRRGERMMEPEFGCRIWEYSFETVDYTTLYAMKNEVERALVRWEPRISKVEAAVSDERAEQGCLLVSIRYVVRATNNPYNMVYPFYINEGE